MRILDIGCGKVTTAVQYIDAIDISQNMIEIGRRRAAESNIENITLTRGTLAEFNAESANMDAVLGLNVIHLLPDWQSALFEVVIVLKPGGIFISSTGCRGDSPLRFIKLFVPRGK